MALRVLLVVAGLAAGAWALARDADVRACRRAGLAVFTVRSDAQAAAVAGRVQGDCRGAAVLASAATLLARAGRPQAARALAADAAAREPENADAWVAVGLVARSAGDGAGLRRARMRLRALDARATALD